MISHGIIIMFRYSVLIIMIIIMPSHMDDAIEIIADRKQEGDNYYSFLDWSIYSVSMMLLSLSTLFNISAILPLLLMMMITLIVIN